ncbi:Zn-dependent exopeptidase [Mycena floridula]|nr:Zn-dependent exopeptidase [Mycena floridula]
MDEKYSEILPLKGQDLPNHVAAIPPPKKRLFRRVLCAVFLGVHLFVYHHRKDIAAFTSHPHGHHKFLKGKEAEKLFLSVPNEESCIEASRLYAGRPHMAGSEGDLDTAKEFLALLQRELGIPAPQLPPIFPAGSPESQKATRSISKTRMPQAWIDVYYPVMNTPLDRALQAVDDEGKVVWEADLEEHADDLDPLAGKYSDAVPAYHGLSAAGDVTGKLIYANYGTKEDYDDLVAKGVNLTGSILIVRYGANFRGLKIRGAQELGAAGVLIYTDPRDYGVVTVENGFEAYPHGPAANPSAVQRGSVQFLSLFPGDPTTPERPAYPNATRTEGENIPKIPSLPISWANAEVLLKTLKGGWEGKNVRLVNNVDTRVMPIWNVMGVLPGYIKDEVVIMGNHRDAWVMGAADPTSGTASMHETIRGLGALFRKGWKPLRTIVFASWDAEEFGLIGSTEFGEDFPDWIHKNVVAYLNLDGSASGSRFSASASPLLSHLVHQTATEIPHPVDADRTLWDATKDHGPFIDDHEAQILDAAAETTAADSLGVGVLGSGSDYTVFLQRLGVASMNHGFGTTVGDAPYHYHSVYDSERWMELYGDPGFTRHVAVAKHLGLIALRLATEVVLPLNNTHYAVELEAYLDKVESIVSANSFDLDLSAVRKSIKALRAASLRLDYEKFAAEKALAKFVKKWHKKGKKLRKLKHKLRKAYCKVQERLGHPCKKHSEDSKVHSAGDIKLRLGRPVGLYQEQREHETSYIHGISRHLGLHIPHGCSRGSSSVHPKLPTQELKELVKRIRAVNQKLVAFERGLISKDGLIGREWYRHLAVAPGKHLGYGATTLPGLTESITLDKNSTLAEYEANRLKELIDALTETLRT